MGVDVLATERDKLNMVRESFENELNAKEAFLQEQKDQISDISSKLEIKNEELTSKNLYTEDLLNQIAGLQKRNISADNARKRAELSVSDLRDYVKTQEEKKIQDEREKEALKEKARALEEEKNKLGQTLLNKDSEFKKLNLDLIKSNTSLDIA